MSSMKVGTLLAAVLTIAFMGGCATTGMRTVTGTGFIGNFSEALLVTEHGSASKKGEACTTNILGVYSGGDASIDAAKRDGHITTVSSVDSKVFAVLPFYGSLCTIVRGE